MSAQSLPNELWRAILRQATHVPFLLDTEWTYDPDQHLWEGWDAITEGAAVESVAGVAIAASQVTKRVIVMVCREWRELGVEYLYEHIRIVENSGTRSSHASQVDSVMKAVSDTPPGWWTKRVDCPAACLTVAFRELLSLLDECKNLQMFVVTGKQGLRTSLQSRLAEALQDRFPHSLRRMDFMSEDENQDRLINLADTLPNVPFTSLSIAISKPVFDLPLPSNFSTITTLTIRGGKSFPSNWYFPNLRNLSLDNFDSADIPDLAAMLERHHLTLLHLHLQPGDAACDFDKLLSRAVNLRSITCSDFLLHRMATWAKSGGAVLQLFGVTHLGVSRPTYRRYLFDSTSAIDMGRMMAAGVFPNLRVLRLLRDASKHASIWRRKLSEVFLLDGVRVEDMEG